jgi:outer membrane immunogenic protein
MKTWLLAGIALGSLVAPAVAAEVDVNAAQPTASLCQWCGFYIGGDVGGYGARETATTNPFPSPGFGAPPIIGGTVSGLGNLPTSHKLDSSGAFGAIHYGYNWQTNPTWLLGIEADIDFVSRAPTSDQTVFETLTAAPGPAFNMSVPATNHYLVSLRGRLGWLVGPWMLYGTGGAAWTSTSYTATATGLVSGAVFLPGVTTNTSFNNSVSTGWVAGAGIEWMLSPNWLVRAEYLHYDFSGSSGTLPLVFAAPFGSCAPGACNWTVNSSGLAFDTGRVGLSYKFPGTQP